MRKIFVFGAGLHPKQVIDAIEQVGKFEIVGFIDATDINSPQTNGTRFGIKIVTRAFVRDSDVRSVIVAINTNFFRARVVRDLIAEFPDFEFITVVHPTAVIGKDVQILPGSIILAGAVVGAGSRIGGNCLVNTRASVDHDCILQDFSSVLPGATVCGEVEIGECSAICAGAIVIHRRKIGSHTIIGAGSVVLRDVPDLVVAVGNPSRIISQRTTEQKYL